MKNPPVRKAALIVDDENEVTDLLSVVLFGNGYETICEHSGNAAFATLQELLGVYGDSAVRVIISDWVMPNGSGIELLKHVRMSKHPNIPFILTSGAVSRTQLDEALILGADAVLVKPFTSEALMDKINLAIRNREKIALQSILPT